MSLSQDADCGTHCSIVSELGTVDGEVLQIDRDAAIHAAFFHSKQGVNLAIPGRINAHIEAVDAQLAVIRGGSDEAIGFSIGVLYG